MKFFARKRSQRTFNVVLVALLVISSFTASVPFLFSQKANAAPGVSYTTPAESQSDWTVDRSVPSGGWAVDSTSGNVTLSVDQTKANTSSTFYQTEGISRTLPTGTDSVKASVLVASDWGTKPNLRVGLWGVAQDAGLTGPSYPIIEYAANVSGYTGWRVWNANDGTWNNVAASTNIGGLNTVEIVSNFTTGNYDFYVNNTKVYSYSADGYVTFKNMIFNNYNAATGNNLDNYTVEWSNIQNGVLTPDYSNVYVATTGSDANYGTDATAPFATIQKALDSVATGGTVHIADGTYTEKLSYAKANVTVIGQSETGTIIKPLSNQYGQGFTSESLGGVSLSNLTVSGTSASGGAALKFHNFSGLTLTNIDVTGVSTPHSTGIDINGVSNVSLNNVNVTGFGKNGIAVTAKFAASDVLTQNVAFNNVSSNNNSWAGLAFYNSNNSGSVAGNITGVTFTGASQLENNGEGLFFEGDTDANHIAHNIPLYTISGVGNAPVDLGSTTFSGNFLNIDNYQTNNVNALNAVFGTKTGNQMNATEQATENNLIVDKRDYSTFGLVNYYTSTVPLAAPTNLRFQFQYDPTPLTSNLLNITAKPSGNNLELLWDAPAGTVTGYHIYETYPNGDAAPSPAYQGPNTNAWLNLNGFGQHGQGAYTYQVVAVDAAGNEGTRSAVVTLNYDSVAPVVTVTPVAGSLLHGSETFHITVTDANLDPSTLKHIYVYLYNNNPPQKSQGASVDLSTGSADFTVDTTKLADGLATFDVGKLYDAAGNASGTGDTYFKNYTIDNTAPAIPDNLSWIGSNNQGAQNGFTNVQKGTLSWKDSTPTDVDHYVYKFWTNIPGYFDGQSNAWSTSDSQYITKSSAGGSIWTDFANQQGTYYFCVEAVDAAGNPSACSNTLAITYDNSAPTTAPVVTADGVISGHSTNQGSVNILWTQPSTDTVKYDYKVWTDITGDAYNGENNAYFANDLTGNSRLGAFTEGEGTYFVQVRAIDAAGNASPWSDTFSVVYDTTKPSVSIPTYGTVGNVITPNVIATDQNSPLTYAWTTTVSDSDVSISSATAKEPTFTVHNDGTYSFTLTVTDPAGNATPYTFKFTYLTPTTPIVAVANAPANAAPTNNGTGFTNVTTAPAADQGVLGATTTNNNPTGDTAVKGATDTKNVAAAATTPTKGNIFGLAWYWWLLILAAIAAIWAIIAARRRHSQES